MTRTGDAIIDMTIGDAYVQCAIVHSRQIGVPQFALHVAAAVEAKIMFEIIKREPMEEGFFARID